jgi:hypothetical protein
MNSPASIIRCARRGSSLMETVVAVGVLAVAVPLIFGSFAESGNTGQTSSAETRAPWMVRTCMEEIDAARSGEAGYFPATATGEAFPPAGETWALAFADSGAILGRLPQSDYENGLRTLNGRAVRYIATARSLPAGPDPEAVALTVRVTIEFPAGIPAAKRRNLHFLTRIP